MLKRIFKIPDFICTDCGVLMYVYSNKSLNQSNYKEGSVVIKCTNQQCSNFKIQLVVELEMVRGSVIE